MEALKVENLSKDFGGVRAVHNISFEVAAGERLAIIGPNGAGKTTLFNLLNGQLRPTSGRVLLGRQDITFLPTHRRAHLGVARSFQITRLFLELTVLTNALLALQGTLPSRFQILRPITASKELFVDAKKLLTSMYLWAKRHEPVHSIAYGEQRRLEIALTLASNPKLLLLDEPSCGLTTTESVEITKMIRDLGSYITVIMVAHDMDLVFGVAQRIIVLHYGEIIAEGTCDEIRANSKVKEIYIGSEEASYKCSD